MQNGRFQLPNAAHGLQNGRFQPPNVANSMRKRKVPNIKCCNSSIRSERFQLQNAANSIENGRSQKLKKHKLKEKLNNFLSKFVAFVSVN